MGNTLNISLTDDMLAFVERNSGNGTLYATPDEFIQHVLREKMERSGAAQIRDAILDGYDDAIHGRTVPYQGNLRQMLKSAGDCGSFSNFYPRLPLSREPALTSFIPTLQSQNGKRQTG